MLSRIEMLVLTGMSGAGKSVAMQSLEDLGYFCVDNLPPALIPKFVEVFEQSSGPMKRVALACDLRGGDLFQPLLDTVRDLRENQSIRLQMIFFDADDETLVRRYKETRRRHPFAVGARLLEGIQAERHTLTAVRLASDVVLDTTAWKPTRLKNEVVERFSEHKAKLPVHILSFGFKYGIPIDADMILDVRFLPNPHYVDELRPFTGEDQLVYDYVMRWPATQEFLRKTQDFVDFLIPEFTKEGKSHLVIGIGCTGGKHRSVAITRHLAEYLRQTTDVHVTHRDAILEGNS